MEITSPWCFQTIETDVQAHKPGLDQLSRQAEEIAESSADSRLPSYVQQLEARFKALSANVKVG